jgi:hypothetical protein
MKIFAKCLVLMCGAILGFVSFSFSQTTKNVDYPVGYRLWAHVKSVAVAPPAPNLRNHGIHHIYANQLAMQGYKTGHFPDGSIIVFDLRKTQTNNGVTKEVSRSFIDVMQKDSKHFEKTGGWGFEEFLGDNTDRTLSIEQKTTCFNCHASQKEKGFVFSIFQE